jgi:hypothetical protein
MCLYTRQYHSENYDFAAPTEAIVGRNVLNQLIVTLNGLANTVEISQ